MWQGRTEKNFKPWQKDALKKRKVCATLLDGCVIHHSTCCYINSEIDVASSLPAEQNMKEEYPFSPPKVKYVSRSSQIMYSDTICFSYFLSNFLAELKTHKKVSPLLAMLYHLVRIVEFTWSSLH